MRSFLRKTSSNGSNGAPTAPIDPPAAYIKLVARQDWDAVRKVLAKGTEKPHIPPDHDDALHFTCRFHPPLDVVRSTAGAFPGSVSAPDSMGRFPLHIAAKWGASAPVVSYLSDAFPRAAGLQDAMGKTPLHLFCESYARRYSVQASGGRPLKESMIEIVKALTRTAPDAVNLEDMDDMTALEYAIDSEVDRKVVRIIQKACEKDWKSRRTPGTKHEIVHRSLLERSQQQSARLRKDLLDMTASMDLSGSSLGLEETECMDAGRQPINGFPIAIKQRKQNSARAFAA